ncbi:MAG: glucose 1-dehydrogenase [Bacteroidetes bacterium]|nr:MAG: glucose 1-dehydrogenase [Bacteroidota bacterium]
MNGYLDRLFGLHGKTAVVIGGGGVLGGRMAAALGKAGAAVVVSYRTSKESAERVVKEIVGAGGKAETVAADTTDKGALERLVDAASERFGGVDILVNAPGVNSATPFFDIEAEEWDRVMENNLKGMFLACQVFGALMQQRRSGSIINISSVVADIPQSKVAVYNISKAGVNSLTRFLARELAPDNVRVNALQPGIFPAEQNRALLTEERKRAILAHTPMNRFGEPDELAGAAVWLASDASSFVTGAFITVDGGFSAMRI